MKYQNYTNMDARFTRPYRAGDRLIPGWAGETRHSELSPPEVVLEAIFVIHNYDDRPDGHLCPSLSVGDVTVLGEAAWSCAVMGWKRVEIAPADIQHGVTWTEIPHGS